MDPELDALLRLAHDDDAEVRLSVWKRLADRGFDLETLVQQRAPEDPRRKEDQDLALTARIAARANDWFQWLHEKTEADRLERALSGLEHLARGLQPAFIRLRMDALSDLILTRYQTITPDVLLQFAYTDLGIRVEPDGPVLPSDVLNRKAARPRGLIHLLLLLGLRARLQVFALPLAGGDLFGAMAQAKMRVFDLLAEGRELSVEDLADRLMVRVRAGGAPFRPMNTFQLITDLLSDLEKSEPTPARALAWKQLATELRHWTRENPLVPRWAKKEAP